MRANSPRDRPIHRKDRTVDNDSLRSVCSFRCTPFCEFCTSSLCNTHRGTLGPDYFCSDWCSCTACFWPSRRKVYISCRRDTLRHSCLSYNDCWTCTESNRSSLHGAYIYVWRPRRAGTSWTHSHQNYHRRSCRLILRGTSRRRNARNCSGCRVCSTDCLQTLR